MVPVGPPRLPSETKNIHPSLVKDRGKDGKVGRGIRGDSVNE